MPLGVPTSGGQPSMDCRNFMIHTTMEEVIRCLINGPEARA